MVYPELVKHLYEKYYPKNIIMNYIIINFNDFEDEETIFKIPINNTIILIDEFTYPCCERTYKNLIAYLDGIREHNNIITFIVSNELNLHESDKYKSLFL